MWKHNGKGSMPRIWLFCDGSTGAMLENHAVGSRQRLDARMTCAAAAVARSQDGRILDLAWEALPNMTNNEAEYAGLIVGLKLAKRLKAQEAICVLDSEVVVGQMEGRFAINSARLREWHWRACAAAREVPVVRYRLAPREWNRLADGLAGQATLPWQALQRALEAVEP